MLQTPNTATIGRMTISSQCWAPAVTRSKLIDFSSCRRLQTASDRPRDRRSPSRPLLKASSLCLDLGSRIADEFPKSLLVPSDAGVSHSLAIRSVLDCACLAAIKAIELRTQLVLRRLADVVAGVTFSEGGFAGRQILR